jgi:ABC-type amino acid transport substrate-binding protein
MWIIAFFGMMTNYSENVLGIYYREKSPSGEWHGGAMYYLENGLGAKPGCKILGMVLAILFSIFCFLASFGIGNMTQVNSISGNMEAVFGVPTWLTGIVVLILAGLVILGGLKRIASVTEKIVPFMVILYMIGTVVILILNFSMIGPVFSAIFHGAFRPQAVVGGAAGITITPSRQERVDFSDPYFTSVQYVIYPNGEMAPDGTDGDVDYILWDSLAGKKIGVQTDTTGDIYVNGEITGEDFDGLLKDTGASETRYDNAQLAVDAMGAGQVDVVVVDYLPASYIVEKNSGYACAALYYPGGEGEQPSPTEEQYAICVTKGQDELLSAINEVLAELGEDGINALVMEHMGLE